METNKKNGNERSSTITRVHVSYLWVCVCVYVWHVWNSRINRVGVRDEKERNEDSKR